MRYFSYLAAVLARR
jgi:iron complex outermembrane receptor protein